MLCLWQSRLKKKRDFVRYISHEIRTPLNTVLMGLQLAVSVLHSESAGKIDEAKDIVMDCCDSCRTAVEILNDILAYDKLEAGDLKLNKTIVDIKSFTESCVRPFSLQVAYIFDF